MPEKIRTYEASSHSVPRLNLHASKLQTPLGKDDGHAFEEIRFSHMDEAQLVQSKPHFSRDVILRLIDWLKDK